MKYILFTVLLLRLTVYSSGQQTLSILPNQTNKFIESSNISWALDTQEAYSFVNSKKIENKNIFNEIITMALSDKLESYVLGVEGFDRFENSLQSEHNKFSKKKLSQDDINFILSDSLKEIKFHEILYLDNYLLKCKFISAAPLTNYSTSTGIKLGSREIFFCCTNPKSKNLANKKNDLIHVWKEVRTLNIDSFPSYKMIKQTYGMNLVQSMWYGASQGFVKLIDIKNNKTIAAKDVMTFSYLDSVQVSMYDSTGSVTGYFMKAGEPVFPYKLNNSIQFNQDIYFNQSKNTFITTISDCFLFVKNWDEINSELKLEKRFRVVL